MENRPDLYSLMDEAVAFNVLYDTLAPDLPENRAVISDYAAGLAFILYAINSLRNVSSADRKFFPPRKYTTFLGPGFCGMAREFMPVIFPNIEVPQPMWDPT